MYSIYSSKSSKGIVCVESRNEILKKSWILTDTSSNLLLNYKPHFWAFASYPAEKKLTHCSRHRYGFHDDHPKFRIHKQKLCFFKCNSSIMGIINWFTTINQWERIFYDFVFNCFHVARIAHRIAHLMKTNILVFFAVFQFSQGKFEEEEVRSL